MDLFNQPNMNSSTSNLGELMCIQCIHDMIYIYIYIIYIYLHMYKNILGVQKACHKSFPKINEIPLE